MSPTRWIFGAVLAAGVAFSTSTFAADPGFPVRNAGELAVLCAAKPPDIHYASKQNFCHGFAQGVFSSELERAKTSGGARPFCVTSGSPSRATTLNDFVKWIDAKPALKSEPAVATLLKFLGERLPCKPASGKS